MTAAEIVTEAAGSACAQVVGGIHQNIEVARMRRHRMIAVDAVLGQQLPIGADRIFLAACHDRHATLGLIADDVEILPGVTEILVERNDVCIEGNEIEVAIAFVARHGLHVRSAAALEVLGIGFFARLASQLSVGAERPAVIEALERLGVALALAADLGAAVRASVQQGTKPPLHVTCEQNIAARNRASDEVAGFRQFRGMAEIQPATVEDFFLLRLEDLVIDEVAACDLEDALCRIYQQRRPGVVRAHGVFLLQT